jgi:tetratricopeptide (TPR) repeat protein
MRIRFLVLFAASAAGLCAAAPIDDAVGLYKAKRYPEARGLFEKISAAEPGNPAAHYYLGVLAEKRSDTDEAVKQLETATKLDPKNSTYFLELGGAYGTAINKAGMFAKLSLAKQCCTALETAVQLAPDSIDARNGLMSFYRTAPTFVGGGMSKAYEQAAEIKKRDPVIGAYAYGQLYVSEKKYDDAFVALEGVLQTHPDNYLALYSIGRTAAESGLRLDRGEQALRRCLELTPGKNEPGPAAVQWRLGNIAEKRGARDAARLDYETALKVDPAFQQAIDSLAKLK